MLRALLLLAFSAATGFGQANEFKEISFAFLSDRNVSPLGVKALALRPGEWKHAETPHFVYHFFQSSE